MTNINDGNWHRHAGGPKPESLHDKSIIEVHYLGLATRFKGEVVDRDWPRVVTFRVAEEYQEPLVEAWFWQDEQRALHWKYHRLDAEDTAIQAGGRAILMREVRS